ncbi:MAG: DNA base-flipping protein [Promethearchaeota archaeon]|nr:MAG: DNA base-flipping protein [Candidatus Lokiarchaeota archaeon]
MVLNIKEFTKNVIKIIQRIPKGKILTYGAIAKLAGNPQAARQVSWILHSSSKKYDLPWHRIINSKGEISLKIKKDKNLQKHLLEKEGIEFKTDYQMELSSYLWNIKALDEI